MANKDEKHPMEKRKFLRIPFEAVLQCRPCSKAGAKSCNMSEAAEVVNLLAPEHLEVMVKNPRKVLKNIRNAGAIFIGPYTPVTVGDYIAGPSHVLPTGGTARFFSGLSIRDFMKSSHIISYTKKALEEVKDSVDKLTGIEGLPRHMDSVKARFE